ncbi:molybdenum cofactor biosynthesis protein MoaE [Alteromonas sp. CYL-A6]|uniref:molybdenum cofactor biosynthesis protein MoaE n=1 Tax=Alteromonas nitratireducens TaxID=3390813 RepID=UPI0034BE4A54
MFAQVSSDDFCVQTLYDRLRQASSGQAGAIVTFTGLVRDMDETPAFEGIELEHYPGMTEAVMGQLVQQTIARFSLTDAGLVHRIGRLDRHEQIVWVGCSAPHRQAAFDGACFMMDMLKQSVPLWKKERVGGTGTWVTPKASDQHAAMRWLKNHEE